MKYKDRIRSLRRVKASDLLPNPKNWRTHPDSQANALRGRGHADLAGELRVFLAEQPADDLAKTTAFGDNALSDTMGVAGSLSAEGSGSIAGYDLLEKIGQGGMGVVYKAKQTRLKRTVAMKMIKAGEFADEEQVKRFRLEAEAAAKFDHPGIVQVYEVGEQNGQHYFSMAFVEGTDLNALVRDDGPLEPRTAASIVQQVAEAVAYAHQRDVIHRDIKPHNILLDAEGKSRLTDFGLAKQLQVDSELTATGEVMGTPSFMPEQALGNEVTVGADIYSLGATLYFLLTGRPPFQAATPFDTIRQLLDEDPISLRRLNSAIPRDLETICLNCLGKDASRRYSSAGDLVADLDCWLENKPIAARRVSRVEKAWLWCKRGPAVASLIAILLVVTVAGTLIAWRMQRATHAAGLVESLLQADIEQVSTIIAEMDDDGYRRLTAPILLARLESAEVTEPELLRGSLALLGGDPGRADYLLKRLPHALPNEVEAIRQKLGQNDNDGKIASRLWAMLKPLNNQSEAVLPLASTLVELGPNDPQWDGVAERVAEALIRSDAAYLGGWMDLLRRRNRLFVPSLVTIYSDRSKGRTAAQRQLATTILRQFAADDPHQLAELLLAGEPEQTMTIVRSEKPFLMGSPVSEAERRGGPMGTYEIRHRRQLAGAFAISSHEVTVAQFREFSANHQFNRHYAREENAPANRVNWYDAASFCNWLSEREGIPREQWCYDPTQEFTDGMKLPDDHLQRVGYRLPTEAEWEYACRAGAQTARYFGQTPVLLDRYAWFRGNSNDRWMLPVGSLKPNDFGLFDMFGNVAEWCDDEPFIYTTDEATVADAAWLTRSQRVWDSRQRVLRGGSFTYTALPLRSANRNNNQPGNRTDVSGFRVARTYPLLP